MGIAGDYILGADRAELERLRVQHKVWVRQAYRVFERARFRTGDTLLDLGSGPGFTTFELADVTGPTGRVVARELSPRFLDWLARERDRRGLSWIEVSEGPAEELELEAGELDGAYARWLLCWLPDVRPVLARVAHALAPGGALVVQDYLDWAAMRLLPESANFRRAVEACMQSWRDGGGDIDIGRVLPERAREVGLEVEHIRPIARIGRAGSLEWRWADEFFRSYLPKLVERGRMTAGEYAAFLRDWEARAADGTGFFYTPTVVGFVLRKP